MNSIAVALRLAAGCVYGSEGYRAEAFLDTLAKPPVWTIGHGTTRVRGKPVTQGMRCTLLQADAWAMADMDDDATFVQRKVTVPLTDAQLGAMTSFCYNIGAGNFERSTVLEALNKGFYRIAADRLLEYDEAGGRAVAGLETRRGRERALFLFTTSPLIPTPARAIVAPVAPVASQTTADTLNAEELASLNPPVGVTQT
jgi:lysozyme